MNQPTSTEPLRAPFPAFGGKSRAAPIVWPRLGQVTNYVEPFCFSAAMLLACPPSQRPRVETINDVNGFVANFWRAVATDPEAVARAADWPVNETDLHARHRDLLRRGPALRALLDDPKAYDAEAAGWWVWGASAWIADGWCGTAKPSMKLPELASMRGVHRSTERGRLYDIFGQLAERLRYTRSTCGDWSRICTPSATYQIGNTAVFLDPPYDGFEVVYGATEKETEPLSARVRAWALENGIRSDMRIALCGYEGEHVMPADWECVSWKAKGGYSNQAKEGENGNAKRERIWFSPACLRIEAPGKAQRSLFSEAV